MQKDAQKWKKRAFKCFLGGLLQNISFCNSPPFYIGAWFFCITRNTKPYKYCSNIIGG